MKLSEAKAKGFELRDLREGEFYTKDIYQITKLDDNHSIVNAYYLGEVNEDQLYEKPSKHDMEDADGDSWFIHKNIPSSYPGLPSPYFDNVIKDNDKYYEKLENDYSDVVYDEGNVKSITAKSVLDKCKMHFNVENEYNGNDKLVSSTYTTQGIGNYNMVLDKEYDNGIITNISYKDSNLDKHYDITRWSENNENIIHLKANVDLIKNDAIFESLNEIRDIDVYYSDEEFTTPELYLKYDKNHEIDGMISVEYTNEGPLQQAKTLTSIRIKDESYSNSWDTDYSALDFFKWD